ncbi:hypothetical protein FGO68_gene2958 [Halteria grandinella]|uniref:Uncharacterized protein n=1 Tax=Halteria grandinella TaxID=5974 RepID=A0A8J8NBJ3_HALGN|nr:hypothetical protein FGO68_gene2958 [Halteria grandinella]
MHGFQHIVFDSVEYRFIYFPASQPSWCHDSAVIRYQIPNSSFMATHSDTLVPQWALRLNYFTLILLSIAELLRSYLLNIDAHPLVASHVLNVDAGLGNYSHAWMLCVSVIAPQQSATLSQVRQNNGSFLSRGGSCAVLRCVVQEISLTTGVHPIRLWPQYLMPLIHRSADTTLLYST